MICLVFLNYSLLISVSMAEVKFLDIELKLEKRITFNCKVFFFLLLDFWTGKEVTCNMFENQTKF
jgi:hypothetical protein